MARYFGIDIGGSTVRVVVLRTSYRQVTLEWMGEAEIAAVGSQVAAIQAALGPAIPRGDSIAVALPGERASYRRLELPAAALRELAAVLPFELEAQLPFDIEEAVFDHRLLARRRGAATAPLFAAVARIDDVRARIDLVREAIGQEPDRVGPGAVPLVNLVALVPELSASGPLAVLELGETTSELLVLSGGEPVFARTVSRGTHGLPGSAAALARELRQTLAAFRALGGEPLGTLYLVGQGASVHGAEVYLAAELSTAILPLPALELPGISAEQAAALPRFAKAVGLALGLSGRSRGLDLRRGPLAHERGFTFLRERLPLLAGLAAVIVVSFLFSTWAQLHALEGEREALLEGLRAASREVLGEETDDPEHARELLEQGPGGVEDDPLPRADAFDVMVELSKVVPLDVKHDVSELDVARGHVTLHGIVPSIPDAQNIAEALKAHRCFKDVKIARTHQVVGENRQKYVLELDLRCEERAKKKGAPAEVDAGAEGGR